MSETSFASLPLAPSMLENLESLGYAEMTPIQAQSLPALLEGKDVLARAETGTGKTVAFGLSVLHRLEVERFRVQALVLCPTRELAEQVAQELRNLARSIHNVKILTLCGGVPVGPQFGSLEHGAHVIVGTPGRVAHHLRKASLSLKDLHTVVLDEADRMLDMGFEEEIHGILQQCPEQKQMLLFSATYPESIQEISGQLQVEPVEVFVEGEELDIEERLYPVESEAQKVAALEALLYHHRPESCLVFCNMKIDVAALAEELQERGFSALAIHGDLSQGERRDVWIRFANKSCSLLVATDVAARGLDVDELSLVVNYDLPMDAEVYIHRVGRTGRAGREGLALSLAGPREGRRRKAIEELLGRGLVEASWQELPPPVDAEPLRPPMVTLCLDGGKRRKVRPGDILGALTKEAGLPGEHVGKIDIFDHVSYIAVHHTIARQALRQLKHGKVKGRHFKARRMR